MESRIILNQKRAYYIDGIVSQIEQFCNNMYSPSNEMWNTLLTFRNKLNKEYSRLTKKYGYLPEELRE